MGKYRIDFNEKKYRLTITLEGLWTHDEARDYQQELIKEVKGKHISSVLLNQLRCEPFPDECMPVFAENNQIPELSDAKVAMLVDAATCVIMKNERDLLPPQVAASIPVPFSLIEEANAFLDELG